MEAIAHLGARNWLKCSVVTLSPHQLGIMQRKDNSTNWTTIRRVARLDPRCVMATFWAQGFDSIHPTDSGAAYAFRRPRMRLPARPSFARGIRTRFSGRGSSAFVPEQRNRSRMRPASTRPGRYLIYFKASASTLESETCWPRLWPLLRSSVFPRLFGTEADETYLKILR